MGLTINRMGIGKSVAWRAQAFCRALGRTLAGKDEIRSDVIKSFADAALASPQQAQTGLKSIRTGIFSFTGRLLPEEAQALGTKLGIDNNRLKTLINNQKLVRPSWKTTISNTLHHIFGELSLLKTTNDIFVPIINRREKSQPYLSTGASQGITKATNIKHRFLRLFFNSFEELDDCSLCSFAGELANKGKDNMLLLEKAVIVAENISRSDYKGNAQVEIVSRIVALGVKNNDIALCNRALAIAENRMSSIYRASALVKLAEHMAALGEKTNDVSLLEKALTVVEKISYRSNKSEGITKIAPYFAALGDMDRAMALFERSLVIAKKISDGGNIKSNRLRDIAKVLAALGVKYNDMALFNEAFAVAENISDSGSKNNTIGMIAEHIAKLGLNNNDMALLKKAVEIFSDNQMEISWVMVSDIARFGGKTGNMALCEYAHEIADTFHPFHRSNVLSTISYWISTLGVETNNISLFDRALEVMEDVSDEDNSNNKNKSHALANIADNIALLAVKTNNMVLFDRAFAVAEEIPDPKYKTSAFNSIAKQIAALGVKNNDTTLFDRALAIVKEDSDPYSKSYALPDLADQIAALGGKNSDKSLFARAIGIVRNIPFLDYRAKTLVKIAGHYLALGDEDNAVVLYKVALAVVDNISDSRARSIELDNIVAHLSALKDAEKRKTLLEEALIIVENTSPDSLSGMYRGEGIAKLAPHIVALEDNSVFDEKTIREHLKGTFPELFDDLINSLSGPGYCLLLTSVYKHLGSIEKGEYQENLRIMDDPLLALVNYLVSLKKEDGTFAISGEKINIILAGLSPEHIEKFSRKLFEHPETAKLATTRLAQLEAIEFKDRGNSPSTFTDFTNQILRSVSVSAAPLPGAGLADKNPERLEELDIEEIIDESGIEGLKFDKALGRTLLFRGENDGHLAVKFLKKGEEIKELHREEKMLRYFGLHGKELNLESIYPTPLGVFRISGITPEQENTLHRASKEGKSFEISQDKRRNYPFTALVYTATQDYFTYLNNQDLSEAEFKTSSLKALGDLFRLARHNLMHVALIELFHNTIQRGRHDRGRYLWMAELVSPMLRRFGTGRMHSWTNAVRFPNLRVSGLADLADTGQLEDLLRPDNPSSIHLSGLQRFGEKASNYYLASYLGDYLLAWSLIVGSRYSKLGLLDWQDSQKVASLAEVMQQGFNYAFSTYTGVPEEAANTFLSNIVNWERMAKQMSYFMTPSYIEGLKRGQIPKEIFGNEVKIDITSDLESSRGWTDKGWSFDGESPDLGPVNGPLPLQELVRALYLSTAFMVALKQK